MKKFLIVSLILFSASFLFCQQNESISEVEKLFDLEDENYIKVDDYLSKNFSSLKLGFDNPKSILNNIGLLSDEQKAELYEEHSKSAALYFGLNMLTLPGLGSLIQGDAFGGTVSLTTGIAGGTLLTVGYLGLVVNLYIGMFEAILNALTRNEGSKFNYYSIWFTMMIAGGALEVVSIITGIVRPFVYSNRLNKELKNILKIEDAKVTLAPVITNNNSGVVLGLALKL